MKQQTETNFYVRVDTYWQNSLDYFVGPFARAEDAQAWLDQDIAEDANVWWSTSNCGGDIRDAWRIHPEVLSHDAAIAHGMIADPYQGEIVQIPNVLGIVEPTAQNFVEARQYNEQMQY